MPLVASLVILGVWGLVQDDPGARIESLIQKLGAEDYATREKATQELRKIGKPAEEALRKAAASAADPEVRERSRGLLEALSEAPKPKPEEKREPERGTPAPPGFGFRGGGGLGSSVQIQTVNGDSTYRLTPGDGSPALVFHRAQAGTVKLDYTDEQGQSRSAESPTLEKFLDEHKDLAGKFGITEEGIDYGGARVSFKGGFQGLRIQRAFRFPPPPLPPRPEERPEESAFSEVTPALRSQLELPPGQGVVVNRVPAGRAAADLGLRKHDILLEISGRAVGSPKEALDLLEKAQSALVLRKGQKLTLGAKKDF